MPSHIEKINIVDEAPDSTDVLQRNVKNKVKPFTLIKPKNNKWSVTHSTATKIVPKAKVNKLFSQIQQEKKQVISKLIQSGTLRPADILSNANKALNRKSNKWIRVNCAICQVECISHHKFVQHMKENHPEATFSCSFWGKAYKTWNSCYKHECIHTEAKSICAVCGRAFNLIWLKFIV